MFIKPSAIYIMSFCTFLQITQLNTDVEKVKIDQQRLDHELDFILAEQKELEDMLTNLEKSVEQTPTVSYPQHADLEREHMYVPYWCCYLQDKHRLVSVYAF